MLNLEAVPSDHAILTEFKKSQAYDVWNKYLREMADDVNRRLVNATMDPLDQLRYFQGVIVGIKMAQQVPENVAVAFSQLDTRTLKSAQK